VTSEVSKTFVLISWKKNGFYAAFAARSIWADGLPNNSAHAVLNTTSRYVRYWPSKATIERNKLLLRSCLGKFVSGKYLQ